MEEQQTVEELPEARQCCKPRKCVNMMTMTLLGAIIGGTIGCIINAVSPTTDSTLHVLIGLPGELFIRALKGLVLPLVTSTMISSLAGLDMASLGKSSVYTVIYFVGTLIIATCEGLLLVLLIRPGSRLEAHHFEEHSSGLSEGSPHNDVVAQAAGRNLTGLQTMIDLSLSLTPPNLVDAASESIDGKLNLLGIMVFCIVLSGSINVLKEEGQPVFQFFTSLSKCLMVVVRVLLQATPIGILSLVAHRFATTPDLFTVLKQLALYVFTVVLGQGIHGFLTLPMIYFLTTKKNPYPILKHISHPMATALGTGSSVATLPVTMRTCEDLGVHPILTHFVCPLGATINMNGTALYEAIAAVFIAQIYNESLQVSQVCMIALTAVLAAMGAAAIPSAGLVTLVMVLQSAKLPVSAISILLPVDWLLDRFRTAINVEGDAFGCNLVHHFAPIVVTDQQEAPKEGGAPLDSPSSVQTRESDFVGNITLRHPMAESNQGVPDVALPFPQPAIKPVHHSYVKALD